MPQHHISARLTVAYGETEGTGVVPRVYSISSSAVDPEVTRYSVIWDALLDYWKNKIKKNGTMNVCAVCY